MVDPLQTLLIVASLLFAAVAAVLLIGLAYLFLSGVRLVGRRGSARVRLALANLHRPGAGAPGVIGQAFVFHGVSGFNWASFFRA